ncbi:MAG: leucyl/phenylalanyl-tRNA--protein transferase [Gammaproteobacteria bacterium]|nr:leucyl/phenylalanyl-tRNA--protein transferase [Gammaproteobacteria bacterium]MDH5730512.1 leucyl/phenylalanyl-tRNA--protein transferase [Gammaproteobacteria bacterium]
MPIPLLIAPDDDDTAFPDTSLALRDPDGLLAVGGRLSQKRLVQAYRQGIFPWYSDDQPILWWSPNPRLVLFPEHLKISRSLKKTMRKQPFRLSFDEQFLSVIQACSAPRLKQHGTWISDEIKLAYFSLFQSGFAHSIEVWEKNELVGGLYGVSIGRIFFGESMFSKKTDASKIAFVFLVKNLQAWGYKLIDCQVRTEHLLSLGAEEIERETFETLLKQWTHVSPDKTAWKDIFWNYD